MMSAMLGGTVSYMREGKFIHPIYGNIYLGFNLTPSAKSKRPHTLRRKRICTVIEISIFFMRSIEECCPTIRICTIRLLKQPTGPINRGPFNVCAIVPEVVQI